MVFGVDNIEMVKLSKTGFTLTELLVVIAIITIISGMIVVNFRKGETSGRLQRSAQLIVQTIRRAQNMAISTVEQNGGISGYGVYFNKGSMLNSFYLFFDEDEDNEYDNGEEIETVTLEKGILIDDISPKQVNKLHIVFNPPDPSVIFNGKPQFSEATITIKKEGVSCSVNPEDCKDVKVGKSGWVNIE